MKNKYFDLTVGCHFEKYRDKSPFSAVALLLYTIKHEKDEHNSIFLAWHSSNLVQLVKQMLLIFFPFLRTKKSILLLTGMSVSFLIRIYTLYPYWWTDQDILLCRHHIDTTNYIITTRQSFRKVSLSFSLFRFISRKSNSLTFEEIPILIDCLSFRRKVRGLALNIERLINEHRNWESNCLLTISSLIVQ